MDIWSDIHNEGFAISDDRSLKVLGCILCNIGKIHILKNMSGCSSRRDKATRELIRLVKRATWSLVDLSHSFSPVMSSCSSVLAEIIANGVFNA